MLDLEERNRARKKAMRLLEHMDRTEKGLTDKLRQAEFSPEAVEDAIAYVKSYGYINDARYARTYISFRMETRSRQKILSELQLKGVDRQTALDAWNEMDDDKVTPALRLLAAAVRPLAWDKQGRPPHQPPPVLTGILPARPMTPALAGTWTCRW